MELSKIVFVNVDTQVDFFDEGGKLRIPSGERLKPSFGKLTKFAEEHRVKVVSMMNWRDDSSKDLTELTPHCMMNTKGSKFIEETSPAKDDTMVVDWGGDGVFFPDIQKYRNIIVRKNEFDPFNGNIFTEALVHNLGVPILDRPTFIVYGVNVGPTVQGLMRRGYEVTVVTDAIKELSGTPSPVEEWEGCKSITTEQITKLQAV